jgi:hypothetical protein
METPSGHSNDDFYKELEAVSNLSAQEQEKWFSELERRFSDNPRKDEILKSVRKFVGGMGVRRTAALKFRQVDEQVEAYLCGQVDGLLDGSMKLSKNPDLALLAMAQISLFGHLMPNLKERLAKPDGRKMIEDWILELTEKFPKDKQL